MRVLVTGDQGFIGSYLRPQLTARDHVVCGVDRRRGHDLRNARQAREAISVAKPDVVVHLAGAVGRLSCETRPVDSLTHNVVATLHVADAARSLGARLVHCSTSEVYGDHGDEWCDETTPFGPSTGIYALTNRWAETVATEYGPDDTVIARPTMPYGPGTPPGIGRRALDNMLCWAEHRVPLTVHEGARRSWCWVADVTDGIRLLVEEGEPGAYNVGRDDDERTMLEVAELACDIAGAPRSLIEQVPAPARQTVVKRLSSAKLRALGWRPTVELEDGMRRTYEWVRRFDLDGNPRSGVTA